MKFKTKIAFLAPYNVYPAQTGGKKFIALFYEYLEKLLPVAFISVPENEMPGDLKKSFHPILGTSKLRYANPLLFFKLKKLIGENKITDLLIVHPYFGWLAWLLKKTTGVRLSLLSHNIEAMRFKSMGKWWWRGLWQYEKNVHQIIDHNFFVTAEDMEFAVKNYNLPPGKCHVITYGIEWQQLPVAYEKQSAAAYLRKQYNIKNENKILLFNGSLNYLPNIEAVNYILDFINPALLKTSDFKYKIIICGKGLPATFDNLNAYKNSNIIYAGFVNDINIFFKGSDIFLNPVISGGGIKTKLVEALGNGLTSVSTETGAFGIPKNISAEKLTVTKDHDWDAFVNAIVNANVTAETQPAFFNHFYWGNIAAKAAEIISLKNK